ncbi:hypothetical protein [Microbacterium proteolyticum]|uniref:hypothetical protein n=1 Tax=Microbacterium proteolyticum TaxID=1572644 RepID=UPI001FAB65BC|nr:hypothetical protein [Microbacterium proteolyticum]
MNQNTIDAVQKVVDSEATRTAWHASPDAEHSSLSRQLVDHTNHVLRNCFREQLGIPAGPTRTTDWKVKPSAVAEASLEVNGNHRPATHIDTDPFVYAVGFRVDEHTVSTNVFPRDSLPLLDLSLTTLA